MRKRGIGGQTRGATDIKAPEPRSRGCSVALLYNTRRPHSSLDRQTPDRAYFNALTPMMVAA
ncbi:hypothetical protein EXN24_25670 [Rhizobium rhizogenes]|uniref:Uncharacterized protein n=1 Tax=Rhizobium rhizogenes TaxID=359 RepID=A0AA94V998_RHIRH|nr:hypothetical protein EXN24_25670 [Rhizobium rhizogenes]